MKNVLTLILAVVLAMIVWRIITFILGGFAFIIHIALFVATIALFIWLVSSIYNALNRQKI